MTRHLKKIVDHRFLHNKSAIHDNHPVTKLCHNAQIMRDKNNACSVLFFQFLKLPEDLILEGNVGLLLAVDQIEEQESLAAYQVKLMNSVNQYMQDVIQEQKDLKDLGNGIVSKVNHLSEAIRNLEEELEHKVSVEELSAYLEMSVEEIRDILRMAGDEIEVEGYDR